MLRLIALLLLLQARTSSGLCIDAAPMLQFSGTSTCGDGVLQPGEVCDDGNRVNGDGCNAWFVHLYFLFLFVSACDTRRCRCNAFDRYTTPCTMAGTSDPCANGRPVAGIPLIC